MKKSMVEIVYLCVLRQFAEEPILLRGIQNITKCKELTSNIEYNIASVTVAVILTLLVKQRVLFFAIEY